METKAAYWTARAAGANAMLVARWRLAIVLFWLGLCVWAVWTRFDYIQLFALGDTDDNLRFVQVRDWLAGQAWSDLRQHRLSPPTGFDIHWSRLVDLPIAGLILLFRPVLGGADAERWAAALAPLIPLLAILFAITLTVRRLVSPAATLLGPLTVVSAGYVVGMTLPLRVDHHGWQLAALATLVAGLADPHRVRGAVTVAAASVFSLVIGLELLPYLAIGTAVVALRWIWSGAVEAPALRAHAAVLAAGSAIGFVLFASAANRAPVCDVLSPVWLSATIGGGALLWLLGLVPARRPAVRLALAAVAAAVLAAGFALAWPDCLTRPERVSPELDRLWLSNVREARPVWTMAGGPMAMLLLLPGLGLVGSGWAAWRHRRERRGGMWAALLLLGGFAAALLAWQTRAAPAAQLLSLPGVAALAWMLGALVLRIERPVLRVAALVAILMVVSGSGVRALVDRLPGDPPSARTREINRANARCPTLPAMRPIARMEPATIFTFVDLGPRLLAVTRHSAIAGPYHRNGDAILAVHHAFDGTPERARAIMKARGATYLLVCPNMSESTIYKSRAPQGFYARLARGERFEWLEPVTLPVRNPLRLWRIR